MTQTLIDRYFIYFKHYNFIKPNSMKKNYFLTLILTLFISGLSFGQVILSEGFSYADGSLVGNGGWASESGTAGDFQVTSGKR